jgi:hypothetical protein
MKIKDFVHNFIEKLQKPKKSFLLILFFPFSERKGYTAFKSWA